MTAGQIDGACSSLGAALQLDALHEPATGRSRMRAWHDTFALTEQRFALSVGNVAGSEAEVTALIWAAREALIAGGAGTELALLRAGEAIFDRQAADENGRASWIVGIVDSSDRTFTYLSAGHSAPLIRYHDGAVAALPVGEDRHPPAQIVADLSEAEALVLYSSGLAPGGAADVPRLVEVLCDERVMRGRSRTARIANRIFGDRPHDEVALLALTFPQRRPASNAATCAGGDRPRWSASWSFDANGSASVASRHAFLDCLKSKANGGKAVDLAAAELVFGELLGNVVRHAPGQVEITLDWMGEAPVLHVRDNGSGFRSRRARERLPTDDLSESGRGLFIINAFATNLRIRNRNGRGTHASVTLSAP